MCPRFFLSLHLLVYLPTFFNLLSIYLLSIFYPSVPFPLPPYIPAPHPIVIFLYSPSSFILLHSCFLHRFLSYPSSIPTSLHPTPSSFFPSPSVAERFSSRPSLPPSVAAVNSILYGRPKNFQGSLGLRGLTDASGSTLVVRFAQNSGSIFLFS